MNVEKVDKKRRELMGKLLLGSGTLALSGQAISSTSLATPSVIEADSTDNELRFPGEAAKHNVVYQFNKADQSYHEHVLFSVGAVLRKYGDDVRIVVSCFGPGLHILGKNPTRPVTLETKQKVSSLSLYGIEFHACGKTMQSLKWEQKDLYDFVTVVDVGASDLIELQEQGFSYISW